jgi:energy-coupling factor transporter transmembrane protein EcfT
MKSKNRSRLRSINPELWLLLSLFCVSMVVVVIPFGGRLLLFLYLAPVMIAAYLYGKRKAILTSVACVLLVTVGTVCGNLSMRAGARFSAEHWMELALWSVMILGFGWGLGRIFGDVRRTNEGFLQIMRHVVGRDTERHNYVRRLSHIAGVIAEEAGLEPDQCETIRRAALLRDIGELDLNREIFRQFSQVCSEGLAAEGEAQHVKLVEVMDLVLASKIYGVKSDRQPVGARILAVATEYDELTSTKKRRSALPPSVAKSMIEREAGKKFDAGVVRAFSRACEHGAFSGSTQRFGQMA